MFLDKEKHREKEKGKKRKKEQMKTYVFGGGKINKRLNKERNE